MESITRLDDDATMKDATSPTHDSSRSSSSHADAHVDATLPMHAVPSHAPHSPASPASASSSSSLDSADEHHECCLICGLIGKLLMCDTCPFVYHLKCVELKKIPDGLWQCHICSGTATLEEYRQRRQAARLEAAQTRTSQRHTRAAAAVVEPIEEETRADVAVSSLLEDDADAIQCAFCRVREPSFSSGFQPAPRHDPRSHEEQFVGPFEDERGESVFVHRACALWSPRVFVQGGVLQNVGIEVSRARWLSCAECGKRGASIGCNEPSCQKTYHYACAITAQCSMSLPLYKTWCVDHAIAQNFITHLQLPSPLLEARLTSARLASAGDFEKTRPDGAYRSSELFTTFLSRVTAARMKKSARFAHLAHLPYDERKRTVRAELRIKSVQEEEAEREKEANKRKRKGMHAGEGEQEEQERQKRKTAAGEEKQLDKTTSMTDAAPTSSSSTDASAAASSSTSSSWSSIGGLAEQIASLKECAMLPLVYPELFQQLHIAPIKGCILVGPPGTGKTLLARALCRACTAPGSRPITFFARKGADVLSRFHGDAELILRTLFEVAKRAAPSVIYFDEIDGLAPVRSSKQNQVHASVVTTLLALMDGLNSSGDVFVLASTNRIDAIDPALRRPGRFDRELYIGLPNQSHREEILRIHTSTWPVTSQLSSSACRALSVATVGFSGADLRALCTEAALLAAHRELGPELMGGAAMKTIERSEEILARIPSVNVTCEDFHVALSRISSSIRRHDVSLHQHHPGSTNGISTSHAMSILLHAKLSEAKAVLDLPVAIYDEREAESQRNGVEMVPMDEDEVSETSSSSHRPLAFPSIVHRLLICDSGAAPSSRVFVNSEGHTEQRSWHVSSKPHNPALLVATLLQHLDLENCTVHALDIPSLLLDEQSLTLQEACVRKFYQASQNTGANLFYLPRLDEWWSQTSIPSLHPLRAALISCLRNLASAASSTPASSKSSMVFVATTTCTRTAFTTQMDVHPFLLEFFKSQSTVAFVRPSPNALSGFYSNLVKEATGKIARYLADFVSRDNSSPQVDSASPSSAPAAVSPSSILSSLETFLSSTSSPLSTSVQRLQSASSTFDYSALQRVHHDVERSVYDQLDAFRTACKRSDAASKEDEATTTLQAVATAMRQEHNRTESSGQTVEPHVTCISMLLEFVADLVREQLAHVSSAKLTDSDVASVPTEWQKMANQHATATMSRRDRRHLEK